jgi:hypothetical protein
LRLLPPDVLFLDPTLLIFSNYVWIVAAREQQKTAVNG